MSAITNNSESKLFSHRSNSSTKFPTIAKIQNQSSQKFTEEKRELSLESFDESDSIVTQARSEVNKSYTASSRTSQGASTYPPQTNYRAIKLQPRPVSTSSSLKPTPCSSPTSPSEITITANPPSQNHNRPRHRRHIKLVAPIAIASKPKISATLAESLEYESQLIIPVTLRNPILKQDSPPYTPPMNIGHRSFADLTYASFENDLVETDL